MFYTNLQKICKERGTTPTAVAKAIGISTSMTANWKKGGMPRGDTLQKLASYFGVTTDYLLGSELTTIAFAEPNELNGYTMFKQNFIRLCNQKGESPSAVCIKVGITPATFSCWTDESVPRKATLMRIADYFGVSVNYLLGTEKENAPGIKPNAIFLEEKNVHLIPVYETVSAGFGALADNSIIDYTPLYFTSAAEAAETICIKVKGDSMYPKIEEGDVIQVHKTDSVDSGTIAVVLLDGDEGLVKRVEYGESFIELQSINPMYPPMRFEGADTLRIRILGAVKKIIKSI
ncbi:MAG: LexA family transcriptional regulator [Ruminococcaceae bacterium]|nr:LexA family transcriptional regulator [Oscillospiraceae bacterium]